LTPFSEVVTALVVAPSRPRLSRRSYLILAGSALASLAAIPFYVRFGRRGNEEPPTPVENALPSQKRLPNQPTPTLPEVLTLRQGPIPKPVLRNLVLCWLETHNRWGDKSDLMERIKSSLDKDLSRTDGFLFIYGPRLLQSRRGTLLAAHVGGLYQVDLPDNLARDLNAVEGNCITFPYKRSKEERPEEATVLLSGLVVNDADHLDGRHPIQTSLTYQIQGRITDQYALRLMFYHKRGRRTVLWYLPRSLIADRGELSFSFPSPASADFPFRGPYLAFVEMAEHHEGKDVVVSNTLAVLLLMVEAD
jgi:hypothetical protein